MPASDRIPVIPDVLKWARESAGLDPARAAKLVGVSETTLERWETGELQPTIKQLRKAAAKYHRPLAVLLLPEPPHDFDAMRDFRRLEPMAGPVRGRRVCTRSTSAPCLSVRSCWSWPKSPRLLSP
jgi:transcriptional regulator with XRE-family HTH domain